MTMNQAAALRVRWKERADLSTDCEHLNLELEWNDLGHSTGNYICILCGESVAQRHLAACDLRERLHCQLLFGAPPSPSPPTILDRFHCRVDPSSLRGPVYTLTGAQQLFRPLPGPVKIELASVQQRPSQFCFLTPELY